MSRNFTRMRAYEGDQNNDCQSTRPRHNGEFKYGKSRLNKYFLNGYPVHSINELHILMIKYGVLKQQAGQKVIDTLGGTLEDMCWDTYYDS